MRFIQGTGNALVQTATYAIITFVFADNREKYLGYAEAVTGIGLMVGPVIGGPLYLSTGYFESFVCFAGILVVSLIVLSCIAPNELNSASEEELVSEADD
jgi:MFS family permease